MNLAGYNLEITKLGNDFNKIVEEQNLSKKLSRDDKLFENFDDYNSVSSDVLYVLNKSDKNFYKVQKEYFTPICYKNVKKTKDKIIAEVIFDKDSSNVQNEVLKILED